MSYRNNDQDVLGLVFVYGIIVVSILLFTAFKISQNFGADFVVTMKALFSSVFLLVMASIAKIFWDGLEGSRWSTLLLLISIPIWGAWWPVFETMSFNNPFDTHWLAEPITRYSVVALLVLLIILNVTLNKPYRWY